VEALCVKDTSFMCRVSFFEGTGSNAERSFVSEGTGSNVEALCVKDTSLVCRVSFLRALAQICRH
jgi:hypothetical protein